MSTSTQSPKNNSLAPQSRIRKPLDGLVHISALSNTFVKDPHSIVKAGQVVKVKVLEVDEKRKRIALTMRLTDSATESGRDKAPRDRAGDAKRMAYQKQKEVHLPVPVGAMAAAFAKFKA